MDKQALIQSAFLARRYAYAPYSGMAVGAALLAQDGRIFTGCNIENAAYSPTLCAERTALAKAISEGCRSFQAIAVVGGPQELDDALPRLFFPCGVCRQTLAEHCQEDFTIIIARSVDDYQCKRLGDLLPDSFSLPDAPESL